MKKKVTSKLERKSNMSYHHDDRHSHSHHHYSRDGIEQTSQWEQIGEQAKLKNEQHERGTS